MADTYSAIDHALIDKLFEERDVQAAEFLIVGIQKSLESDVPLQKYQRLYLARALKSLMDDPEDAKAAFGIKRPDKKGNFKGVDLWNENRDRLIYLHELKFRELGYKGDELFKSIKSALSSRFTLTNEAINRAKKRIKHEYEEEQLSLESIESKIDAVGESLI